MLKRVFDLLLSLILITFFSPLFLLVYLAVKISSNGPAFFIQTRITEAMREFQVLKFRTLQTNFDKNGLGIQIDSTSHAITPIGRILRKSKLDELPQLINIVKGEMSFVGPRPELPRRVKFYTEKDREVFLVKAGLTSPASILLSDEEYLMTSVTSPETFYIEELMPLKIEINRIYLEKRNFFFDFLVLVVTGMKILGLDLSLLIINDDLVSRKNSLFKRARLAKQEFL